MQTNALYTYNLYVLKKNVQFRYIHHANYTCSIMNIQKCKKYHNDTKWKTHIHYRINIF